MHGIGIIHTDLKPENILLKKDGRFHKCKDRKNYTKYYIPRDTDIKLIDFGNAVVADEEDVVYTSTINTRQFRAPEVTLKSGEWDGKSDVWGVGCIILELITGHLFFATHDTYEHVAMVEKVCGPTPPNMIKSIRSRDYEKWFDHSQLLIENPHMANRVDLNQNIALAAEIRNQFEAKCMSDGI